MNIVKYGPMAELRNLQNEVNRLFNISLPRNESKEDFISGAWQPSVDIIEGKDKLTLEAEIPGMKIEDVDVSIENNVITIRGERKFEKNEEGDNYHRVERSYGTFSRSFTLPRNVSTEDVKAGYKDGILRVELAKKEEAKARKIEISSEPIEVKAANA